MWYMPYRRVRSAVLVYACFAVGFTLLAIALRYWPGVVHVSDRPAGIDLGMILAGAASLVGGFATVLGLNLASENDGHLEVAWTKPVSREGYALGVFAVDIAAMAACIAFTVICGVVVVDVFANGLAVVLPSGDALIHALAFCGLPLCVYAWIAALSASMKRNRAMVAGLFWPVVALLAAISFVPVPAVHAIANALDYVNPLAIYSTRAHTPLPSIWTYLWGWAVAALLLAFTVLQWRRLEL